MPTRLSFHAETDTPPDTELETRGAELLAEAVEQADAVLVGAASGLSAAAGFRFYYDPDAAFQAHFGDLAAAHGFSSSFEGFYHPYRSEKERWVTVARSAAATLEAPLGAPYADLRALLDGRPTHVLTTNQDGQSSRAFGDEQASTIQGDWRWLQCARPCHDATYDAVEPMIRMLDAVEESGELQVPDDLLPRCPRCGGLMEPWIRGTTFLEGEHYRAEYKKTNDFLEAHATGKLLFLEIGVGRMTPMFIQHPFWSLTHQLPSSRHVNLNPQHALVPAELGDHGRAIEADAAAVLAQARELRTGTPRVDIPQAITSGQWGHMALGEPRDGVGRIEVAR